MMDSPSYYLSNTRADETVVVYTIEIIVSVSAGVACCHSSVIDTSIMPVSSIIDTSIMPV